MATGTPMITCGNSEPDATAVHEMMKPEFNVIYAGHNLPKSLEEVPKILSGSPPPASSLHTQIASNSFEKRPVAMAFGGGYDDEAYEKLRDAIIEACRSKQAVGLAFFRADRELTERLAVEGKGPRPKTEGYAAAITKRLKDKLIEVGVADGLKEEDVGKLFLY